LLKPGLKGIFVKAMSAFYIKKPAISMDVLKAKIVWFPDKLSYIKEDNLETKIPWDNQHLIQVREYMKQDGLLFPGVVKDNEIHCGHYRFRVAKEMGYKGIEVYQASTYAEALKLTQFTELCYKHYKEYKEKNYV